MEGHCTSEKQPFLPRQVRAPTCQPPYHCAWWLAREARLCATALTLSGDEAQHVRFRHVRTPRQDGGTRSMHHRRALHERQAAGPSAPGPCSHMPASVSPRVVACACSALERHYALSLWGRAPARALPTRARAAPSRRHSVRAPWKGNARARSHRSFGARPVLSYASYPSHCAWWLARVARFRASALALSGDEAQHVRFRRARAPLKAGGTLPMHHGRALHEREAAVPSAPGPWCHVPALPLTVRGGLRVQRACAPLRSLSLGTRPSTCAFDARTRRAKLAALGSRTMEGHCTS